MGSSQSKQPRLGTAGVTLYEIVLVMVIMLVLMAIGVPAAGEAMQHSRVNRAAAVVQMDLRRAFSLAARQRKPVELDYDSNAKSYTVVDVETGDELLKRSLGDGTEFDLDGLKFSTNPIEIAPNGFASSALTVAVAAQGYGRTVTMLRAGMVRVVPR